MFLDRPSSAVDVLSAANEVDVETNDVDGRVVAKTRWSGGDVDSVRRGDHGDGDEDGDGWCEDVLSDVKLKKLKKIAIATKVVHRTNCTSYTAERG